MGNAGRAGGVFTGGVGSVEQALHRRRFHPCRAVVERDVERIRDAGPFLAGVSAAAFTLGLSAGRLVAHALETRFRAAVTVRLAALVVLPALLITAMDASLTLTIIACFAAGLGVGPIEPAAFRAVATRSSGAERGLSLAAVTAVAYLGYLISPTALKLVAENIGCSALWGSAASLAGCAALLALRVPRAAGQGTLFPRLRCDGRW
ncbi:MAG: MFS transporter [Pseudomonadota bacterium]